jgi:hypothetical protein
MVVVTKRAKEALLEKKLAANIKDRDVGLRVAADDNGDLVLVADRARADDQVIEHAGATVLLVGADAQGTLRGVTLDCQETPEGDKELVLARGGFVDGAGNGYASEAAG